MALNIPAAFYQRGQQQGNNQHWLARAMGGILTPQQKYEGALQTQLGGLSEPLTQAWGDDLANWSTRSDIDFTQIGNAGKSYLEFKKNLEEQGGRGLAYAKKQNLLNPIAYKKKYDESIGLIIPQLAQKVISYAQSNNATPKQMRALIGQNPGLRDLFLNAGYGQAMIGDQANPMYDYLIAPKTVGQQWGDFGENLGEFAKNRFAPTMTGLPLTIAGGAAAYKYGPKLYNWMTGAGAAGAGGGTGGGAGAASSAIGTGGKVPKSRVMGWINKIGGKSKAVQRLTSIMGKSKALKTIAGLGGRAFVPLAVAQMIWAIANQGEDKYAQGQQQMLNQVQALSQPPKIAGVKY